MSKPRDKSLQIRKLADWLTGLASPKRKKRFENNVKSPKIIFEEEIMFRRTPRLANKIREEWTIKNYKCTNTNTVLGETAKHSDEVKEKKA